MDDPRYIAERTTPEVESGGSTADPLPATLGLSSNVLCPVCDTPRLRSIEACPRCERRRAARPPLEFRFGIASLMLLTTLIAVLLGLLVTVPGVAVMLGLLSVPAYMRAWRGVTLRQTRGELVTAAGKVIIFVGSLGVVLLILIAVVYVWFLTSILSWGVGSLVNPAAVERYGAIATITYLLAFLVGICEIVVPILVGIFFFHALWPRPD